MDDDNKCQKVLFLHIIFFLYLLYTFDIYYENTNSYTKTPHKIIVSIHKKRHVSNIQYN